MSADEYDPEIARLFARTPTMADAPLFAAEVQTRLARGSKVRTVALTLAGVVGGVVAVRESLNGRLSFGGGAETVDRGLSAVAGDAAGAMHAQLSDLGLSSLSAASGMQLFWIAAGALIALAAAGVVKLSQEV